MVAIMRPPLPLAAVLPAILLAGLAFAAPAATAAESEAVRSPRATATLVSDSEVLAPGEPFRLGLRLRLAPGWHTYWRNAGDAGAPPEIAPELPEGWRAGDIEWPAPERIPYGPLVNFGYTGEVLLPMRVEPAQAPPPGESVTLTAHATWLVCADVCIPEEGSFRLTLPMGGASVPSADATPLFEAAEAAQPRPAPWQARAGADATQATLTLEGPGLSPASVQDAFFFPADPGVLDNAAPQPASIRNGAVTLAFTVAPGLDAPPASLDGVVAITDGGGQRAAFAVSAPVLGPPEPAGAAGLPLWQATLFALLGGLILNLMPCVFPVLAMKAMGLARLSGGARTEVRTHGLSYTAGVLATFAALAGLLLGLRAAGLAVGWGFQFTSPVFVAGMAWLMLAVGLNLSGVFALGGPVAAGQSAAARHGHLGSFATGGLAVLVATPCTAPFMAAAIGAGLAMPPAATMAVFLAMGLGLAAPYALLAAAPGLARMLPRPGPWMERLRQALAFPMYGAAAWLVWVLAQQKGPDGVLSALAGAVLLAFGLWALGSAQRAAAAGEGRCRWGMAAALAGALAAAALLPRIATAPAQAAAEPGAEAWSEARVAALRAEGRPVFVNATAAWCITCQVNERVALRGASVQDAFAARGVAYLKADWTNGDAAIGRLLREHGREGVPLYLYFPPGAASPVVLPQILTEGIVLAALEPARD